MSRLMTPERLASPRSPRSSTAAKTDSLRLIDVFIVFIRFTLLAVFRIEYGRILFIFAAIASKNHQSSRCARASPGLPVVNCNLRLYSLNMRKDSSNKGKSDRTLHVVPEQILKLSCPLCGNLILKFGADLVGAIYSFCQKCRDERTVRIVDGRLIIELKLVGWYTPPENSGASQESG